jgi:molecular chaperone DnaK (HSP70)
MNPYFKLLRQTARKNEINCVIRVLGIDLGTTNSTAAVIEWDPKSAKNPEPRCVDIEQRTLEGTYVNQLLPSMIALDGGEVFIGEGAKRLRADTSKNLRKGRDLFWECKNDIGLERTYGSAPQGYRSAREIGGHLLKFLAEAARDGSTFDRTTVTVPASFQNAQRRDSDLSQGNLIRLAIHGPHEHTGPTRYMIDP